MDFFVKKISVYTGQLDTVKYGKFIENNIFLQCRFFFKEFLNGSLGIKATTIDQFYWVNWFKMFSTVKPLSQFSGLKDCSNHIRIFFLTYLLFRL